MDATICPFDLVLSCRTSENAVASEIGQFPPLWDQPIPRSDYYPNKAPSYENYYGKDFPDLFFDGPAQSPFQSTADSSPESDCISSPILDVDMTLNFSDTSMDIMEPIPWDLSLDQPKYGGLPTSDLSQDVKTASDYNRTTAYRQQSDAFSLGTVASNPWAEPGPDEGQEDDHTSSSRQKRTARSRRQKRDNRKSSETSLANTGGGAPSLSDAASPSFTPQYSRASIGSGSTPMASAASTASSRQAKLRSASRTSKNSHSRPNDTPKERRTRASHNLVEKQYRNRLNAQFESLLSVLPEQLRAVNNGNGDTDDSEGNDADRRVSKGEVLEMARKHIQLLEQERAELERKNLELRGNLRWLKGSASDGTVSSSSQETPLDFKADANGETQAGDQDKS
ncbi:hypothetical protein FOCG_17342 [Fusarium oxysporum f. sp. radicis-lycopersici 26381]|nr:hypothetical protein FOWG_17479 [Fusarium oxysporum f. sp. lycopersici MN25]EWZ78207.1 hypothetical protein FOWG_17479 [Fusarium oxysporum f. sp. lycopersici MN25]EXL40061.1 hypothetical protein FOCG_17342 [Fusarium oxysporum f. sp. radicis-lycopersici 26381]EXL40062.1 hypothetical protein FOCG_17342 [Fusarium oxysporum f. sp. radicis-lycopersici 26381]